MDLNTHDRRGGQEVAFSPEMVPAAIFMENRILDQVLSAFLNTEYYLVHLSNKNPSLVREVLSQILEPDDRERNAHILHFLEQQQAR